jgi:hypothetical protein
MKARWCDRRATASDFTRCLINIYNSHAEGSHSASLEYLRSIIAMLDPLTALGLAGNIVQFVDFSSKLISEGIELYNSMDGALTRNVELNSIVEDLSLVAADLGSDGTSSYRYSKDERALAMLADQCKILADNLLEVLQDLTVRSPHKKWKSVRQALRTVWKDKEIQDIQNRLQGFRNQLTLRLVALLKYGRLSCHVLYKSFPTS